MFATPPGNAASAPSPLTRAIGALCAVAQSLLTRLANPNATAPDAPPLPKPLARNPQTAAPRVTRALAWLTALAHTFAGGRHYLRPNRITVAGLLTSIAPVFFPADASPTPPTPTPPSQRCHPPRARTEATRAAARLRYMRAVFATVPTATLAARLARRLGLTEASPDWPHALTEIADPPALWSATNHAPPEPFPSVGVLVEAVRRFLAVVPEPHLRE